MSMKKKILLCCACVLAIAGTFCAIYFPNSEINNTIGEAQNIVTDEIKSIDEQNTTEIKEDIIENEESTEEVIEASIEDEQELENQEVEDEGFELQGEIAYDGDRARSWNVELGDFQGLTYYSQIDSRWKNILYTSTGNATQTIGSSGCGPTSAAMVVSSIKGTITPNTMASLFVQNGYRSANNGTYWSAYRAVADEFNIGYTETTDIQRAIQLLQNNNYVICSCGNGLFTTGGHYIVIVGIENDTLKIFDPYLYNGKFNTSTRRNKVTVSGNTVYCSVQNFKSYANAKGFFCYKNENNRVEETQSLNVSYTRYVNTSAGLNVRNTPNGTKITALANKTQVTVVETNGDWSRISSPVNGWVSSNYLSVNAQVTSQNISSNTSSTKYSTGSYKVTSNLNVRTGPGTNYKAKTSAQLTANSRQQNSRLGGKFNGYRKGVVCTVTKVSGNWGLTSSGWICLKYAQKK